MKKNLQLPLYFCLFILLFSFEACEKEIKLDVEENNPKLAVLCNFSPDEPFFIRLNKSQSISNPNPNYNITNDAKVQLCSGSQLLENVPRSGTSIDTDSKYKSQTITPQSQETYTLKIEVDGMDAITATSSIPTPVEITHTAVGAINLLNSGVGNNQDYEVKLSIQFDDPADEMNYYQVTFLQEIAQVNNVNAALTIGNIITYNSIDESLGGNFNLMDGGVLFNDFTFSGTTKELVFEPVFQYDRSTSIPKNIIMELRTVSEEYYKYYASVYRQLGQNGTVPFTDPTLIYSNIENGYGVFAGYSKRQVKSIIEF